MRRDLNLMSWRMAVTAYTKEWSSGGVSKRGRVMGARYPLGKIKQVKREPTLSICIQMDPAWEIKKGN